MAGEGCLFMKPIEKAFQTHEVTPDVIGYVPQKQLKVTFKGSEKATLGNELTPTQTADMPDIEFDGSSEDYYTLLVVDPDPPSRSNPIYREILHGMIVNIPGNKITEGEVKASYRGPGPPKGTGLHRYVFLVFRQARKQQFDEPSYAERENRRNFSTKQFCDKYSLGRAEYGNFFQAQNEEN